MSFDPNFPQDQNENNSNSYLKHSHQVPFVMVHRSITNDSTISFKAKGLLLYLLDKPDGWSFSIKKISSHCKEGYKSVATGLKELEKAGYLRRYQTVKEGNRFSSNIYEITQFSNNFSVTPFSVNGKRHRLERLSKERKKVLSKDSTKKGGTPPSEAKPPSTPVVAKATEPPLSKEVKEVFEALEKKLYELNPNRKKNSQAQAKKFLTPLLKRYENDSKRVLNALEWIFRENGTKDSSFWKKTIRGAKSLSNAFDQIVVQMTQETPSPEAKSSAAAKKATELREWAIKELKRRKIDTEALEIQVEEHYIAKGKGDSTRVLLFSEENAKERLKKQLEKWVKEIEIKKE